MEKGEVTKLEAAQRFETGGFPRGLSFGNALHILWGTGAVQSVTPLKEISHNVQRARIFIRRTFETF